MPPKYAIQRGSVWHKSRLESRDFYRKYGIRTPFLWHTTSPFYAIYEPFLLGVGVVYIFVCHGIGSLDKKKTRLYGGTPEWCHKRPGPQLQLAHASRVVTEF